MLNQTPFYAEAGGQVGDTGTVATEGGEAEITDTRKVEGLFIHFARVTRGTLAVGEGAELRVDQARRTAIRANHSATQLLHEACGRRSAPMWRSAACSTRRPACASTFSHSKSALRRGACGHRGRGELPKFARKPVEDCIHDAGRRPRGSGHRQLFGEKSARKVRVVFLGRGPTGRAPAGKNYSIELGRPHVAAHRRHRALRLALGESGLLRGGVRRGGVRGGGGADYMRGQHGHWPMQPRPFGRLLEVARAQCERSRGTRATCRGGRHLRRQLYAVGAGAAGGRGRAAARDVCRTSFVALRRSRGNGKGFSPSS